jgi:hypothetical protein
VQSLAGAAGTGGYLLATAFQFAAQVLGIALIAAVLWWIRRGREGERLRTLPLVALGVLVAAELLAAVLGVARALSFALLPSEGLMGVVAALGLLLVAVDALAALVLAGLAILALVRRGRAPRTVRLAPPLRTLALVLVLLVGLSGLALPALEGAMRLLGAGGPLVTVAFPTLSLLGSLLHVAVLVVAALTIARTGSRQHLLAWAVPVLLWCGVLAVSAVSRVVGAIQLSAPADPLAISRAGSTVGMALELLAGGAATAAAVALVVLVLRSRAPGPDAP